MNKKFYEHVPGFEPRISGSAVKYLLINNVNKVHYLHFLITCWLQPCIQAQMGDERFIYKVCAFYTVLLWVAKLGFSIMTVKIKDI